MSQSAEFWRREQSEDESIVADLLHFYTSNQHWSYTGAGLNVGFETRIYVATPGLKVGDITEERDALDSLLEIEAPWSWEFAQMLLSTRPEEPVAVQYYRAQLPETVLGEFEPTTDVLGGGAAAVEQWWGWVRHNPFGAGRMCRLICAASKADIGYAGFIPRHGLACQVPLYSSGRGFCNVTRADYEVSGTVLTVDGVTLTATVFGLQGDGYYDRGFFSCAAGDRKIYSHSGTTIVLSQALAGIAVGDSFTAAPGCNHTTECLSKFNNIANYQGSPDEPSVNPVTEGTY